MRGVYGRKISPDNHFACPLLPQKERFIPNIANSSVRSCRYNCNGFGESNRDALDNDLILLMQNTNNESNSAQLLASLFPDEIDLNDKRMPKTAGYKIRTQCGVLVETLSECNPHYVRCVKPNDSKQPCTVDASRVAHQAQYESATSAKKS